VLFGAVTAGRAQLVAMDDLRQFKFAG